MILNCYEKKLVSKLPEESSEFLVFVPLLPIKPILQKI